MIKIVESYVDSIGGDGIPRYVVKLSRNKEMIMVNGLVGWDNLELYIAEQPEILNRIFESWKKIALENDSRHFYFSIED